MNLFMPHRLRPYFREEVSAYKILWVAGNLPQAWRHLERAHIIGQPYPMEHTYAHWLMMVFGFRIKNWKEVAGQLPRLLVGGVKSFVGKIPTGNTGGANVHPLKRMEIPADLQHILRVDS